MDFENGDRVRVDIPDETDPDHDRYHGKHGSIVAVIGDDANLVTGNEVDSDLFKVVFDSGECADFRRRDLRSPIDE